MYEQHNITKAITLNWKKKAHRSWWVLIHFAWSSVFVLSSTTIWPSQTWWNMNRHNSVSVFWTLWTRSIHSFLCPTFPCCWLKCDFTNWLGYHLSWPEDIISSEFSGHDVKIFPLWATLHRCVLGWNESHFIIFLRSSTCSFSLQTFTQNKLYKL